MRKQPIGTLADLLRVNQALYLHCEACGYSARMDLKALARALGETMLLASTGRRAVCIIWAPGRRRLSRFARQPDSTAGRLCLGASANTGGPRVRITGPP